MTIKELLDVLDYNRENDDIVYIMDGNGEIEMQAKTKSSVWDSLEGRVISCIQAYDKNVMKIWLKTDNKNHESCANEIPVYKKVDRKERAQKTYANYSKIAYSMHLSDNKVATMAGFTSATMSNWKAGRYTPKEDKINAIAAVLGVPADKILDY